MQEAELTKVMRANVAVHTAMVDVYDNEPHFRPENQDKVREVLRSLRDCGGRLLDLGCGTGFVINLARDLFDEIHGVDVTSAMLDKIDTSSGNITLYNIPAESLPFDDASFDVVTAYAFLHHLEDYSAVMAEAYRVLRPGGKFYVDLDPNRAFWSAMSNLESIKKDSGEVFSDIVEKEIDAVLHTDEAVSTEFHIDPETFNQAEYTKSILGGVDPEGFQQTCRHLGFSDCQFVPQWFLGQGSVMHGQSFDAAATIEAYLHRIAPLSNHLFKYVRFICTK